MKIRQHIKGKGRLTVAVFVDLPIRTGRTMPAIGTSPGEVIAVAGARITEPGGRIMRFGRAIGLAVPSLTLVAVDTDGVDDKLCWCKLVTDMFDGKA